MPSDEHSVHVDRLRNPKGLPDWMRKAGSASYFEITLTVSGVKEEHAAYVAQQLFVLQRLFKLDGSDVETNLSARTAHDDPIVERIYDLIPDSDG